MYRNVYAPFGAEPFSQRAFDSSDVYLTPRQREVLQLLCEGLSNKLICRRLGISPGTAKAHIATILRELGVETRVQAVLAADRLRLFGDAALAA